MITVHYKEGNDWKTDDCTFATLDIAKAHTVKEGYGQYKLYKGDTLIAHLFNQVVAKPKFTKKKSEEPKPEVEIPEAVELDILEEE